MEPFPFAPTNQKFKARNLAPPLTVFPLLCPVREAEWAPGWKYRLIYSQSGFAELGCVFTTPNSDATETVWVVTHYDPFEFEIHFAWVRPSHIATRLEIVLTAAGDSQTHTRIRYI